MKNIAMLTGLFSMVIAGARAQSGSADTYGEAKVRAEITFKPVLHIQLGAGANNRDGDVVHLEMNKTADYEAGVIQKVEKQLLIHHIGTEYAVSTAVSIRDAEDPVKNSLYNIMKLALCTAGRHLYWRGASPDMANTHVVNEVNTGIREADAAYAIVPMMPENARFFREILGKDGKPRTITVDVTYTIAPL